MAIIQSDFGMYTGIAHPGMTADGTTLRTDSRTADADLEFGAAGIVSGDNTVKPATAIVAGDLFAGIAKRTYKAEGNVVGSDANVQSYKEGFGASLVTHGRVWVKTAAAQVIGQVYMTPAGVFTSAKTTGNFIVPGASFIKNRTAEGLSVVELNGLRVLEVIA